MAYPPWVRRATAATMERNVSFIFGEYSWYFEFRQYAESLSAELRVFDPFLYAWNRPKENTSAAIVSETSMIRIPERAPIDLFI